MVQRKSTEKAAAWAGFDLSTTGLALGVRSRSGEEAYAQTRMRGATKWKGQPAFDLPQTPKLILTLLNALRRQGWQFDGTSISFSVRQHDMVLLDRHGKPVIPALSWQCNAAIREVEQLRQTGVEDVVGRVEERFILPKLMWALGQAANLKKSVAQVMTTGDWVALMLTGRARLSTSDALSNGLLAQHSKALATDAMKKANLNPEWFPQVLQSGRVVGRINTKVVEGAGPDWMKVKNILNGGQVVAGLGDNHATGVGCGLDEEDHQTIVVSAGTSGTVNRLCAADQRLRGAAACFEFYKSRFLLMMLADCCKWYDRFVSQSVPEYADSLDELNALIDHANLNNLQRVFHVGGREVHPPNWQDMVLGEQAASTQFSIMLELLLLVRAMLDEVLDSRADVQKFVLTGGLSQSRFFQHAFHAGVKLLAPGAKVLTSARKGPLRYQTAAYGALLNAMRPDDPHASAKLCPTKSAARPDASTNAHLQYLLKTQGL